MSALLDFVKYSYCNTWSVHLLLENTLLFSNKYPLVYFKEFTKKANIETVHIKNDETYKILGVRSYGQGVYLNREILGSTLTMRKYQKAKKNHLFWCKVDTKNGAFGIIPEELEDGLGSSNMAFAELDIEKIDVNYLQLFFKSKRFNAYMDGQVVGTTNRKYIKFNDLLNEIKIPLPKLDIQKQIVDKISNSQNNLNNLKLEYQKYILHFNNTIFNRDVTNEKNLLEFLDYSKLNNWSVQNLLENNFNYNKSYSLVKIKKFIKRSKIQTLVDDDTEYKRVTIKLYNKGVSVRDKVFGKDIGTKKQFIIKEGQFLLSKIDARNGAFGIATKEIDGAIITADFFAYDIDETIINPYFLSLITTTDEFLNFAKNSSTGTTNRQRLNEELFLNVEIPLPSIDEQNDLVQPLLDNFKKQEIENIKLTQALKDFEKEVFLL
ncbi:restriction endonuclease subunit S [Aliarcobacter butzleri]|uniref:restriction endonuclease subunit S n=1 Tax=Aliarcobacter butzleri TaxID=28197 RepID=UPI003AF37E5D